MRRGERRLENFNFVFLITLANLHNKFRIKIFLIFILMNWSGHTGTTVAFHLSNIYLNGFAGKALKRLFGDWGFTTEVWERGFLWVSLHQSWYEKHQETLQINTTLYHCTFLYLLHSKSLFRCNYYQVL